MNLDANLKLPPRTFTVKHLMPLRSGRPAAEIGDGFLLTRKVKSTTIYVSPGLNELRPRP